MVETAAQRSRSAWRSTRTRRLIALWVAAGTWLFVSDRLAIEAAQATSPEIRLQPVAWNLSNPLFVTSPPDGSGRLFIVEQGGVIKRLEAGATAPAVFLDISAKVLQGAQQGLVGLAFHPQFASNGRVFVDYTRSSDEATVVAEYRVSPGSGVADPSETVLLVVPESLPNLAGGMLAFGRDGFLYVGVGQAGIGNDPTNTAQDLGRLLGKILRIDVDLPLVGLPYSSPPSNPFVGATPGRDEIWAYGLRNPWRFSFDRLTGDLLAGDVGNHQREEVDLITRGGNYGWRVREGLLCSGYDVSRCGAAGFTGPLVDYEHTAARCAVVGGYVYRGGRGALPTGSYVFGDFCSGEIFLLEGGIMRVLLDTPLVISSFGEDQAGELYVVDWLGAVYRLESTRAPLDSALVTSVLPGSRSVQAGSTATAFATMIWTGATPASDCGIAPLTRFPIADFLYQTTDPDTNTLVGAPNSPVPLVPGQHQTFLIAFTPSAPMDATDLLLAFFCANSAAAPVIPGLNTLLLSAASDPVADIVAVTSTTGNDGIVSLLTSGEPSAFSVAIANVGAATDITASADAGGLPVSVLVCPTEASTGTCLVPPAPAATLPIAAGATSTLTVFVASTEVVAFDPAYHRVTVRFADSIGVTRGLTSVAVRTSPPSALAGR